MSTPKIRAYLRDYSLDTVALPTERRHTMLKQQTPSRNVGIILCVVIIIVGIALCTAMVHIALRLSTQHTRANQDHVAEYTRADQDHTAKYTQADIEAAVKAAVEAAVAKYPAAPSAPPAPPTQEPLVYDSPEEILQSMQNTNARWRRVLREGREARAREDY